MVDDERTVQKVADFVSDVIECAQDDNGNIIPDYVKTVNETVKAYAELKKAGAEVEVARIKAEADVEVAKTTIASDGVNGIIGFALSILNGVINGVNLKSMYLAETLDGMVFNKGAVAKYVKWLDTNKKKP